MASATQVDDGTGLSTPHVLLRLAQAWPGPLTNQHRDHLDMICRKLALSRTLLARYDADWRPIRDRTTIPADCAALLASTLLAWARVPEQLGPDGHGLACKSLNAALSALDAFPAVPDSLREQAELQLHELDFPSPVGRAGPSPGRGAALGCSRTLPLTILAYEGPCLRAYLSMMRRAGLRAQRIVLLVLDEHPHSHKPVGRLFPGRLRTWYAEKTQELSLNHWPRRIRAVHPDLVRAIGAGLAPMIDRPVELFDEMYGPLRLESYAERVERLVVRDLRDDRLFRSLQALEPTTILFTGGGILPERLIDLPGLRFLHVHPGHLPFVRGADGLLWSTLVRGQPSMSCFHLAGGLDTGDVVALRDYPPLTFTLGGQERPDDQTLYRAIFSFVDPLLRADLLVSGVLAVADDLQRLPTARQDPTRGVTYHFMHPRLQRRMLARLFPAT